MNGTNKTPATLTKIAPKMKLYILAEKTGLSAGCLSFLFSGKRAGTVVTISKIAKALRKKPGDMFDYLAKIRARHLRAMKRKEAKGDREPMGKRAKKNRAERH